LQFVILSPTLNGLLMKKENNRIGNEARRLKSAVEELKILNELAIAASLALEVDQMLDIIVEKAIQAVKAEQGSILLVTEKQETPLKTLIRQADRASRMMTYKVGWEITGWVLKNGRPLLIEDLSTDERFPTTAQLTDNIKSVLCVPILFKAKIIGLLTLTNKKGVELFTDNDLRLLTIIAAQSGQLIRNSQLQSEALEKKRLAQELEMARKIQLRLLPEKVPQIPGLEIATYFKPADEVSGDYYDFFELPDDKLGVVVADVSGHGMKSALVMTMVKGALYAISQRFESSTSVFAQMNTVAAKTLPHEMFVTSMFLVFDLKKGLLRYVNAGHNPLIHYDATLQKPEMVELAGVAFGLTTQTVYQEGRLSLTSGDIVLLYTDGITEACNDKEEMFGFDRLMESVKENAARGAQQIIEDIKMRLRNFSAGTKQNDDIAVIVLRIVS